MLLLIPHSPLINHKHLSCILYVLLFTLPYSFKRLIMEVIYAYSGIRKLQKKKEITRDTQHQEFSIVYHQYVFSPNPSVALVLPVGSSPFTEDDFTLSSFPKSLYPLSAFYSQLKTLSLIQKQSKWIFLQNAAGTGICPMQFAFHLILGQTLHFAMDPIPLSSSRTLLL